MMTSLNGNISALLALGAGNSPVPGEFHTQRPVTRSFDLFSDLRSNKGWSKQPRRLCVGNLRRRRTHYDVTVMCGRVWCVCYFFRSFILFPAYSAVAFAAYITRTLLLLSKVGSGNGLMPSSNIFIPFFQMHIPETKNIFAWIKISANFSLMSSNGNKSTFGSDHGFLTHSWQIIAWKNVDQALIRH